MILARTAVALAFVGVTGAPAWAQNTDVVTLPNGDRNTGEILELERGDLRLDTDDAGTIVFDWVKVATVEAARQFEVVTSDGRHFLGSLGRTSAGSLLVVTATGAIALPLSEVTRIHPIGLSLWARFDGSIDAGFTYTRSSGIAQFNLNSNIVYRRPSFLLQLTTSDTLVRQEREDQNDDRGSVDVSYVRDIGRQWFGSGVVRFENNESLGLTLRSQLGAWAGLRLVNSNRARFEVGWGAVYNNEDGIDTEPRRNVEGLLGLQTWYDGSETDVDASVDYFPGLSDWGRHRLQLNAAVKRDLWEDAFVSLNLFDTFDSAPPSPDAARNDVGVVTSVGWSF